MAQETTYEVRPTGASFVAGRGHRQYGDTSVQGDVDACGRLIRNHSAMMLLLPEVGAEVGDYRDGAYFSVAHPADWYFEAREVSKGTYLDTTIRSGTDPESLLMRIDVSPTVSSTDPEVLSRPVVEAVRRISGYQEVDYTRTSLNGYDALHWEWIAPEKGTVVRKEDVFLVANGRGVAILTEAPASDYESWRPVFDRIRASLEPH
jgi:hypothetical protein